MRQGDFFMHGMMKILNNINKELLREKSENQSGEYTLNYTKIHLYKLKLCEKYTIYQRIQRSANRS